MYYMTTSYEVICIMWEKIKQIIPCFETSMPRRKREDIVARYNCSLLVYQPVTAGVLGYPHTYLSHTSVINNYTIQG